MYEEHCLKRDTQTHQILQEIMLLLIQLECYNLFLEYIPIVRFTIGMRCNLKI